MMSDSLRAVLEPVSDSIEESVSYTVDDIVSLVEQADDLVSELNLDDLSSTVNVVKAIFNAFPKAAEQWSVYGNMGDSFVLFERRWVEGIIEHLLEVAQTGQGLDNEKVWNLYMRIYNATTDAIKGGRGGI